MLRWQLFHRRIIWPIFMAYCGIAGINQRLFICQWPRSTSIGYKPLYWCVFMASNWQTSKQWERWPIPLFLSLAQTLKYNRFWRYICAISAEVNTFWTKLQGNGSPLTYTQDKFRARKSTFFLTVLPCQICMGPHEINSLRYWLSVRSRWLDIMFSHFTEKFLDPVRSSHGSIQPIRRLEIR